MRRSSPRRRGFSILAVLLILTVVVGGLVAILYDAGEGLREVSSLRSKELVNNAMEFGLQQAMNELAVVDPETLVRNGATAWDIFTDWENTGSFVCPAPALGVCGTQSYSYPPGGTEELRVRVGLRLGQRTQAPVGEDVNGMYGYVAEVLVAVWRAPAFGQPGSAVERAVYGVRLPATVAHSN